LWTGLQNVSYLLSIFSDSDRVLQHAQFVNDQTCTEVNVVEYSTSRHCRVVRVQRSNVPQRCVAVQVMTQTRVSTSLWLDKHS